MDDLKALTCELADAILERDAECRGAQSPSSIAIARLILAEIQEFASPARMLPLQ